MADLTEKELTILKAFWNRVTTTHAVAEELGISYDSCIRTVRDLIKKGYIKEVGIRDGHSRRLTAIQMPNQVMDLPPEQVTMVWNGKMMTIPAAFKEVAPNVETAVQYRVSTLLYALIDRGYSLQEADPPSGWDAKDIRAALIKVLGQVRLWEKYIDTLVRLPIWFDDPNLPEKIGYSDAKEKIREYVAPIERHFMADNKGPLER